MASISKKGIITGVVGLSIVGALFSPNKKADVESITLTIPNQQNEYDINTEISVDISILPENADSDFLKYETSNYSVAFADSLINTGAFEGTYDIYVSSGDVKSNTLSINVVDFSAREEAAIAEEKRLAKEEEQRQAEEAAAREAEAQRLAEEEATKEAEIQKQAEEAAKQVEIQKQAEEAAKQTGTEAQIGIDNQEAANSQSSIESQTANISPEQAAQTTNNNSVSSTGNESNFNTYDNASQQQTEATYVLNTSTMKIHHPSCSSVKKIAPHNYSTSNSSIDELIAQGYSTCGNCFK